MNNASYEFHTYGCKVNTYDTGLMQKNLGPHLDSNNASPPPRVHIVNTCAVTAEATKEALRKVRKIKSKDPFSTIVVTGCGAQVDTEHFASLAGVDLVVANSHKGYLPQILDQYFKGELPTKVFKDSIFRKEDLEVGGGIEAAHTRSFLKIQDGCNSFCTYCVIPFARGKSRSISKEILIQKINHLHTAGVLEVVLTGVHIGDWQQSGLGLNDLGLEDLIEGILKETQMPRLRLTSLEPPELTPRLLDLFSDARLCPHFHMSMQSANTETLALMKRKYTQAEVVTSLERINKRVPNAFVGMDIIVGFPTETQEQFEDTLSALTHSPWTKIHVFPYSERPGTKAAKLENLVSDRQKRERSQVLRQLSLQRYNALAKSQVGQTKEILVLGDHTGLSADYWNVELGQLEGQSIAPLIGQLKLIGKLITVEIKEALLNEKNEGHLIGLPMSDGKSHQTSDLRNHEGIPVEKI